MAILKEVWKPIKKDISLSIYDLSTSRNCEYLFWMSSIAGLCFFSVSIYLIKGDEMMTYYNK